jgi:xylulokinase
MKNYASEYSFEQLTTQAEKISAGCDGLSAFASAGSYKGLNGFVNAESFHSKAHYFRALMESSAYTLKQLIEKLSPQDKPATIAATGGGSKNPLWLQIKADMTGSEFLITNCSEPACKGSAMLAAESCRWYESLDDVSKNWIKIIKKFKPNQQTQKLYERWISGYKKIGQN